MRTAAELTLGREPEAVPKARRFVATSLVGEIPVLLHDTELVVSELVTNALLHGQPPVSVRLVHKGDVIRVEVEDSGRSLPVVSLQDPDNMTGRGLALVAGLSTAWGIDPARGPGKVVWAEIDARAARATSASSATSDHAATSATSDHAATADPGAPGRRPVGAPDISPAAMAASRTEGHGAELHTVRLGGVPTALLLSAKAHIDNVVRELTLLRGGATSGGAQVPPAMARLVDTVTGEFALARTEIKRQALASAARGDALTDLELRLPLSYAEAGKHYLAALDEADRYARSARLLTMAPPLSHRTFRQWYVGAVVDQLRAAAEGRTSEPPVPLPTVLAARLDEMEDAFDRLANPGA